MKFAKELDDSAVPEWKGKYLDYKGGKKKLDAVSKAIHDVGGKSPGLNRRPGQTSPFTSLRDAPVRSLLLQPPQEVNGKSQPLTTSLHPPRSQSAAPSPQWRTKSIDVPDVNERSPLRTSNAPQMTRYGSIIGSPPKDDGSSASRLRLDHAPTMELPKAALDPSIPKNEQRREPNPDPDYDRPVSPGNESPNLSGTPTAHPPETQMRHTGNAYQISRPIDSPTPPSAISNPRYRTLFAPQGLKRSNSVPEGRPLNKRMFSFAAFPNSGTNRQPNDVALESYRELDYRESEFFHFLDGELAKIEVFYKEREDESSARLEVLRDQLHTMREHRLDDLMAEKSKKAHLSTVSNMGHNVGKTSRSMAQLGTPTFAGSTAQQDYVRRQQAAVPYHIAKRKLKTALQELYRGLELLKSYSIMNRTAFRKIIKKYNKTVAPTKTTDTSPGRGRHRPEHDDYMTEKVNKAHFVQSEIVDSLIRDVEDLYARYFERGNHKLAVGKLRAKLTKPSDYGGPMFRTGVLLSVGIVFGIQGLIYGVIQYYERGDEHFKLQTSYLLQLYGGYFIFLALSGFFVYDAWTFDTWHVNYPFIFELDTRNKLNWRQLSEMPSVFACLLGVCMWLNFTFVGGMDMYIYWPVILIVLSVAILFLPIPGVFYSGSRKWFLESCGRLLLAGLYPVEFRDFFLGDMFCSETYALGNTELFFCLYTTQWGNPPMCNSSNSRLLGFFSTLPGIWRALQCARRYRDTWDWYPHLANMGKYSFTILQYMTLSLWRMEESSYELKALFITCATINSVYTSVWDIFNDWSFSMDPYSKPPLLRQVLAYRKHLWWYYGAIILDPILRFLWVGYVIFPRDYQVSNGSTISFVLALLEVVRRGAWVIFRVENEHCTNVARNRATKQTELPYPQLQPEYAEDTSATADELPAQASATMATSSQIEGQAPLPSAASSLRRRQGAVSDESPVVAALRRVGAVIGSAHAQDYEKRRPEAVKEPESDDDDSDRE